MGWFCLAAAIACEIAATLSLKVAAEGKRAWYIPVTIGYVVAFSLFSVALAHGLPLGVAYGVWTAVGVAVTAVLSRLLFKEALTPLMAAGIALIAVGVLMVDFSAH